MFLPVVQIFYDDLFETECVAHCVFRSRQKHNGLMRVDLSRS